MGRGGARSTRLDSRRVGRVAGRGGAAYDHIGSTSVPGLSAKPFLDVQVRVLPLPQRDEAARRLATIGLVPALGSRPDSPGVTFDLPRGAANVPAEVWQKLLFVAEDGSAILHVRRRDSPWGQHTVLFRDFLRAHDAERDRYAALKRQLAVENRGKPDYDDYTRAKTQYFDEIQPRFEAWASDR